MKPELRAALAEKGRCDLPGVLLAAAAAVLSSDCNDKIGHGMISSCFIFP